MRRVSAASPVSVEIWTIVDQHTFSTDHLFRVEEPKQGVVVSPFPLLSLSSAVECLPSPREVARQGGEFEAAGGCSEGGALALHARPGSESTW